MQWIGDLWTWFLASVGEDPAGWIAIALVVAAAVVAFVRRRRLGEWIRNVAAARERRQRFRTAESTLTIRFIEFEGRRESFVEAYGNSLRGGTIRYVVDNLGPADVKHLRVEPTSPEVQVLTRMYWDELEADHAAEFQVHIPFAVDPGVTLRWQQGRHIFAKSRAFPFQ
jgi:MYXO-CTERM domain-containing protein